MFKLKNNRPVRVMESEAYDECYLGPAQSTHSLDSDSDTALGVKAPADRGEEVAVGFFEE